MHVKIWVVISHAKGWVVLAHVKFWFVLPNVKSCIVLRTTLSLTWQDKPPLHRGEEFVKNCVTNALTTAEKKYFSADKSYILIRLKF